MPLDFNVSPYFDDYTADSSYYKILFQPGRPVQTRELNSLQSILQNQVTKFGDHVFKNGAMIIPGHIYFDNTIKFVKLMESVDGVSPDVLVQDMVGKNLVGEFGVVAKVVNYSLSTELDPTTIFIKYVSGPTTGFVNEFASNELLLLEEDLNVKVRAFNVPGHTGKSAGVSIDDGIYYINGYFVKLNKQSIILDKYTSTPTYKVGLEINETVISETEDDSLYDNALGYSNYGAPGAHRYKIELILTKRSYDYDVEVDGISKFVDLLHLEEGNIVFKVESTKYSEIEKFLARRTYDESGDYEVTPFDISVMDYRSNNRGAWASLTPYLVGDIVTSNGSSWVALSTGVSGSVVPDASLNYKMSDGSVVWVVIKKPVFNNGYVSPAATDTLDDNVANNNRLIYKISPGKAYIRGFEVEKQFSSYLSTGKALEFGRQSAEVMQTKIGVFAEAKIKGIPNIAENQQVDLYQYTTGDITGFASVKSTATASFVVVGGVITSVSMTFGGFGYDKNALPTATVSGGTGAVLVPVVNSASQVTHIKVVNGGTGYTAGAVTISAPPAAPAKIGTARIRSVTHKSGVIGDAAATYNVELFDIRMGPGYDFATHVRSYYNSALLYGNFVLEAVKMTGSVSVTSGNAQVNGVGTSFMNELTIGQYIRVGNSSYAYVSLENFSNVTLNSVHNFSVTLSNQALWKMVNKITNYGSLLQPLPRQNVRSIRSADDILYDISYSVTRLFPAVSVTAGAPNYAVVTLSKPGETFDVPNTVNYIVSDTVTGVILTGITASLTDSTTLQVSGMAGGVNTVDIIGVVLKDDASAKEKVKTLTVKTVEVNLVSEIEAKVTSLGEADAYRIISVKKSFGPGLAAGSPLEYPAGVFDSTAEDITDQYTLNNGQTAFFYGISSIEKMTGAVPNNSIQIVYEYFTHSEGDFFSVNSYPDLSYARLEEYQRDYLDFRPRADDLGTGFDKAEGASVTEPLRFGYNFICSYSYYLPRRDLLTINSDGIIKVKNGTSGYSMKLPTSDDDSMDLAAISIPPGSLYLDGKNTVVSKFEHQRYTMRDIGKLADRVENLEYYVQLSLLEKETISENVVDSNGYDRFKSGILVDSFENQSVSDGSNPDYRCATDFEAGECRAYFDTTSIRLSEMNISDAQRASDHYQLSPNGNYILLPYVHEVVINQNQASNTINVNPFAVFTFIGSGRLYPPADVWTETEFAPQTGAVPLIDLTTSATDTPMQIGNTVWNNWQTVGVRSWNNWQTESTFQDKTGRTFMRGTGGFYITTDQTRTGVQKMLTEKTTRVDLGNKFDGSTIIPWVRSRPVFYRLERLKPNTTYSGMIISGYEHQVLPAIELTVTINNNSGILIGFDDTAPVYAATSDRRKFDASKVRQFTSVSTLEQFIWNEGSVVYTRSGQNMLACAIVVDIVKITPTSWRLICAHGDSMSNNSFSAGALYMGAANVSSNSGDIYVGDITVAKNSSSFVNNIRTDALGDASGIVIPKCNDSTKIPAGSVAFTVKEVV